MANAPWWAIDTLDLEPPPETFVNHSDIVLRIWPGELMSEEDVVLPQVASAGGDGRGDQIRDASVGSTAGDESGDQNRAASGSDEGDGRGDQIGDAPLVRDGSEVATGQAVDVTRVDQGAQGVETGTSKLITGRQVARGPFFVKKMPISGRDNQNRCLVHASLQGGHQTSPKHPMIFGIPAPFRGVLRPNGEDVEPPGATDSQKQCPYCFESWGASVFEMHVKNCSMQVAFESKQVKKPVKRRVCRSCGVAIEEYRFQAHWRDCRPADEERIHNKKMYVMTRDKKVVTCQDGLVDTPMPAAHWTLSEIRLWCKTNNVPVDTTGDGRQGNVKKMMIRNIETWMTLTSDSINGPDAK